MAGRVRCEPDADEGAGSVGVTLCLYVRGPGEQFDVLEDRFRRTYDEHPAGAEHELSIFVNVENGLDIAVLQQYAAVSDEPVLMLSGYARILADNWLRAYLDAIAPYDVAAVATSGSYEQGISSHAHNPHLRTANIMVKPQMLSDLAIPLCASKRDCYEFEHGEDSIYERFARSGYRCLVVGRSGTFEEPQWRDAETYRVPGQPNLLISDKRTDLYEAAPREEKRNMESVAWMPSP